MEEAEAEIQAEEESTPTTQQRQIALLEEAVVHPLREDIDLLHEDNLRLNRRIDVLVDSNVEIRQLLEALSSGAEAEAEAEEEDDDTHIVRKFVLYTDRAEIIDQSLHLGHDIEVEVAEPDEGHRVALQDVNSPVSQIADDLQEGSGEWLGAVLQTIDHTKLQQQLVMVDTLEKDEDGEWAKVDSRVIFIPSPEVVRMTFNRQYINWDSMSQIDQYDASLRVEEAVPEGGNNDEKRHWMISKVLEFSFSNHRPRSPKIFSQGPDGLQQKIERSIADFLGISPNTPQACWAYIQLVFMARSMGWMDEYFIQADEPEVLAEQEEVAEREARQREREAEALKAEMMPAEDGGRLADWSMYHLCEELGINFPDEGTRRRVVAKAEQSIRPAQQAS